MMTEEVKYYIESNIDKLDRGELTSLYVNCPMKIFNEFNNMLFAADICYPEEIHSHVVVCGHISGRFKNVELKNVVFDPQLKVETFYFECFTNASVGNTLQHDLSVLLPKRHVEVFILDYIGKLFIQVEVG